VLLENVKHEKFKAIKKHSNKNYFSCVLKSVQREPEILDVVVY